jgi:tetratricopeptide (TPR) repeat protein
VRTGGLEDAATGHAEASSWRPGSVVLGDFVVERELGRGGMGTVHLVRSRANGNLYAVKTANVASPAARHAFMGELQVWVDLPRHPHLVPCRFFRGTGRGVAVFADYVAGGTLSQWIRMGRASTLQQALDLAIQLAWGLQAAHDAGVVHQDVKPQNALLKPSGLLKVSDFGLASARLAAEAGVEALGMTPLYRSPEQADGARLTAATDVWSWGVSVLEMLLGEVTWRAGEGALQELERARAEAGPASVLPRVAEVLRRCFERDPAARFARIDEAASALEDVWRRETGSPYPRRRWDPALWTLSPRFSGLSRRTDLGREWDAPERWRARLHVPPAAVGGSVRAAGAPLSRRGAVLADLGAYADLGDRLEGAGPSAHETAQFRVHKARVHVAAGDLPGALAELGRALNEASGRRESRDPAEARASAAVLAELAECQLRRRDPRAALAACERLAHPMSGTAGDTADVEVVVRGLLSGAAARRELGDLKEALAAVDTALGILKRAGRPRGQWRVETGRAFVEQCHILLGLGKGRRALAAARHAISVLTRRDDSVGDEGRLMLARAYDAQASATAGRGVRQFFDYGGARATRAAKALVRHDWAIGLVAECVHRSGRPRQDLNDLLAGFYASRAETLALMGLREEAATARRKAVRLLTERVEESGAHELLPDLERLARPDGGAA